MAQKYSRFLHISIESHPDSISPHVEEPFYIREQPNELGEQSYSGPKVHFLISAPPFFSSPHPLFSLLRTLFSMVVQKNKHLAAPGKQLNVLGLIREVFVLLGHRYTSCTCKHGCFSSQYRFVSGRVGSLSTWEALVLMSEAINP